MKQEKRVLNLWDAQPKRRAEWESDGDGLVTILVPKFRHPFLVKWILPRLAHPFFRVKLDAVGSAIWAKCDGTTEVGIIATELQARFGASVEPVAGRIGSFLRQLERGDLITVDTAKSSS